MSRVLLVGLHGDLSTGRSFRRRSGLPFDSCPTLSYARGLSALAVELHEMHSGYELILVAQSRGGALASVMASMNPSKVLGCVLYEAPLLDVPHVPPGRMPMLWIENDAGRAADTWWNRLWGYSGHMAESAAKWAAAHDVRYLFGRGRHAAWDWSLNPDIESWIQVVEESADA